jgi:hypothetical protein
MATKTGSSQHFIKGIQSRNLVVADGQDDLA